MNSALIITKIIHFYNGFEYLIYIHMFCVCINRLWPSHLLIGPRCTGEKYARNLREKIEIGAVFALAERKWTVSMWNQSNLWKIKKQPTTVHVLASTYHNNVKKLLYKYRPILTLSLAFELLELQFTEQW
jgi:hypothetical protein